MCGVVRLIVVVVRRCVWWWIVGGGMGVSVWVLLPAVVWGVWVSMVVGVSGALWPWSWIVWWAVVSCFGWI